jgi:hypothetical protein
MKHLLGLVAVVLVSVAWPAMAAEMREFTETLGRKVRGELLGLDGDKVLLITDQGKKFTLDLSKFSEADREYIREQGKPSAESEKKMESLDDAVAAIDELVVLGIFRGNDALKKAHSRDAVWKIKEGLPVQPFAPLMPNPPLTDEQFVRRVYLDIVGRIPTAAEASAFLEDANSSKRARLIDQLLSSDGSTSHLYNYLADMLRIKSETEYSEVRMMRHGDWLKQQLQWNRPYDEIVRDIITAKGKAWEGAAGFYLRDIGMPLEHLTHSMWAFLATDMSCAQCHDHPFNDWTQRQFYEMASFFRSVRMENARAVVSNRGDALVEEAAQLATKNGGADPSRIRHLLQQVVKANRWKVWDDLARPLLLPGEYKYRDGAPGEPVLPRLIRWSIDDDNNAAWKEAEAALQKNGQEARRKIFAKWLTHPQNPRFAMTIAHRLWTRAFGPTLTAGSSSGVPLVMAKLGDPAESSNPELLAQLAREMVRVKFDLRAFMRTIYNTQAWQRTATVEEVARGQPYYFQGPMLRRMTAEQVWDSVVTLAVGDVPPSKNQTIELKAVAMDVDLENPKLDAATLLLKLAAIQSLESKSRSSHPPQNAEPIKTYAGLKLMRASDQDQPAPANHALRTFGQSERELMDSNTTEGSVTQVLSLMQGKIAAMVTSPESHVLRTRGNGVDGVKSIYLSVLGRNPTDKEKARAEQHLRESGEDGWTDLVWALLNSREFLFVQ